MNGDITLPRTIPLPWASEEDGYAVSIIVPTFNRANYIEECLDSLLNQSCPPAEIIVIDDGSEDDTRFRVQRYGDRIRYVYKENEGKSTAVNLGLRLVQGNLVWIFDDDDVALPEAIENRIAALTERPDAGFVYSPHYLGVDGHDGRIVQRDIQNVPHYDDGVFFAKLMEGCFFHLATALVRIEAFRVVGGFDVGLLRSQDYDMQIRLAQAFKAAYAPEPSFIFRQHMGSRGTKASRSPSQQRTKVFQTYDNKVGLKLRSGLPLGEYLCPRVDDVNTVEKTRRALLSRMVIMASKGCIAEMFEDLRSALATLKSGERLGAIEARLIAATIYTGYCYPATQTDWAGFKSFIRETRRNEGGKQAVRALARGFFRLSKSYPGSLAERARKLRIAALMTIGFD